VVTTISPHHIFGFIFALLVPFTAAVPFRRTRVESDDELFALASKQDCMIVTVPAFLKRLVESPNPPVDAIKAHSHYIYEAGGFLPPPVAKKTSDIFGFWPMELYGTTEASGIAYLQTKFGPQWTPLANRKLGVNKDPTKGPVGCLIVYPTYDQNAEPTYTGDMIDMLPDGRFIMKGRADTIVKIEETRVSLLEVETQLRESGLVSDAVVIPLEDKRQYLAAALVLNEKGKAEFDGKEKADINAWFRNYLSPFFEAVVVPRKWRFVDAIPSDDQGKRPQPLIASLFD
jgi:acyl-coenzyme A synthetase/AMP-(fatty) acid ligase